MAHSFHNTPRRWRAIPLLLATVFMLSACGDTRIERAGSGAVMGAAAGGAAGALCCGTPGEDITKGALVGMISGALIGFLLNHPIFFDDGYRDGQRK